MSVALSKFELCSDMTDEDRERLTEFLEEKRFAAGRRLFGKGDEASELLLITEGHVRFEDEPSGGVFGAGSVLGAFSLSSVRKRATTAEAQDDVHALAMSRESYWRLRSDYPALALALQEALLSAVADDVEGFLAT